MANKKYSRYFIIISLVLMIYLTFLLIKPYLLSITTSVILAFLFYPLYKRFYKQIKRENLAALLMVQFVLIILFVPLTFLMSEFASTIYFWWFELFSSEAKFTIRPTFLFYCRGNRLYGRWYRDSKTSSGEFGIHSVTLPSQIFYSTFLTPRKVSVKFPCWK